MWSPTSTPWFGLRHRPCRPTGKAWRRSHRCWAASEPYRKIAGISAEYLSPAKQTSGDRTSSRAFRADDTKRPNRRNDEIPPDRSFQACTERYGYYIVAISQATIRQKLATPFADARETRVFTRNKKHRSERWRASRLNARSLERGVAGSCGVLPCPAS